MHWCHWSDLKLIELLYVPYSFQLTILFNYNINACCLRSKQLFTDEYLHQLLTNMEQ